MTAPAVSVIIAGYRAERFIARAVRSALAQTLSEIEVIVVDDASPDATLAAAVEAAAGDPRLRTLRLPKNGGPSAARNAGFAAARGRWLAVLDSDDAMEPRRLETLVAFGEQADADIVADSLLVLDEGAEDGPGRVFSIARLTSPLGLGEYARDNRLHHRSGGSGYLKPMIRTAFIREKSLAYDVRLRIAEDWALIADALALGARFHLLNEPLYRYTVRTGSISHRLKVSDIDAMIAAQKDLEQRHAGKLPDADRRGLKARSESLANARAFQVFVERVKDGRPLSAVAALLGRPGGWPLLRMPIEARLRRGRGEQRLMN